MKRTLIATMGFLMAYISPSLYAADVDIDVVGLFKDAAMLEINGRQQMLRTGETSREGIRLIGADSREAVIELDGEEIRLNLSSQIGTDFQEPQSTAVTIARDELGQYRTQGSINNRPVRFLVDTGANIVALNTTHAADIGLDYEDGQKTSATTASGRVPSWAITLNSVQIGDIHVSDVRAAVIEGNFPQDILLGMSFLSNVEMSESSDVLTIKSKL